MVFVNVVSCIELTHTISFHDSTSNASDTLVIRRQMASILISVSPGIFFGERVRRNSLVALKHSQSSGGKRCGCL